MPWPEAREDAHAASPTGLGDHDRIGVNLLILGYVRQAALLEGDLLRFDAGPGSGDGTPVEDYAAILEQVVDPGRFPALHQVIRSGAFGTGDTRGELDRDFTFGLACILDGVEALIRRRGSREA